MRPSRLVLLAAASGLAACGAAREAPIEEGGGVVPRPSIAIAGKRRAPRAAALGAVDRLESRVEHTTEESCGVSYQFTLITLDLELTSTAGEHLALAVTERSKSSGGTWQHGPDNREFRTETTCRWVSVGGPTRAPSGTSWSLELVDHAGDVPGRCDNNGMPARQPGADESRVAITCRSDRARLPLREGVAPGKGKGAPEPVPVDPSRCRFDEPVPIVFEQPLRVLERGELVFAAPGEPYRPMIQVYSEPHFMADAEATWALAPR